MRVLVSAILLMFAAFEVWADPADLTLTTAVPAMPRYRVGYADGTVPLGCEVLEAPRPLALVDAVRYALCSHLQTRKAGAEVAAKSAALELVRSQYWPTVNGTINGGFRRDKIEVENFSFDNSDTDEKGYSGSLDLTWTLYDFGVTLNKSRSAKFALRAALASRDTAVQTVTLDAMQAFFDVLDAAGEVEAQKQAEAYALESLSSTRSRYESGMAALTDRLQAQTALAEAHVKRITAEGNLRTARGKLAVTIGRAANMPLEVDRADDLPPDTTFLASIEKLMAEAKLNNPDLEAARAQAESAYADLQAARADGRPTFSLNAQIREQVERADGASLAINSSSALPPNNITRDRSVELRISVPLFSGFSSRAHVHEARAAADEALASLEDTERQITLQVWTAYQSVRTDSESYMATIELLANAKDSYVAAKGRYDAGVGTVVDLLNAQSEFAAADVQRIKALSSWRIAKAKLAAGLGRLRQ